MESKAKLNIVCAALALGIAGDALLRATPWGINALLCAGALAWAVGWTGRQSKQTMPVADYWPLLPACVFAAGLAWRDSATLRILDIAAFWLSLAMLVWRAQGMLFTSVGPTKYLRGILETAGHTLVGFPHLMFRDIAWREMPGQIALKQASAALTGVVLAFPFLLLFGGLFMAADVAYQQLILRLVRVDFVELSEHFLVGMGCAWLAGGYLRAVLFPAGQPPVISETGRISSLGAIEVGVALGLLNLLFLSFVIVQFRYLFGGADLVEVTPGITYAEHARRGFFELVTVSALVLPLLLGADWLLGAPGRKRAFRAQAAVMILLLFVIMTSALQRMRLYQNEFGLTELRLYTTVFMAWLVLIFVWFAATVLRGNRGPFAFGTLISGLATIVTLHILNPDALIVRANVARTTEGRHFDVPYAASLSADAVPDLVSLVPQLKTEDQQNLISRLSARWRSPTKTDWRSWNLSRSKAGRAVEQLQ